MWTKKETILFFAGAEAFHTLSHVMLAGSHILPFTIYGITVTQTLNAVAIAINGLITGILLVWAHK